MNPLSMTQTAACCSPGTLDDVEREMRALALGVVETDVTAPVNAAVDHHFQAGGGRFRAQLALSASLALGVQAGDDVRLASACELLHNASLIHDDLQDGDRTRRGREAVWSLFGADIAICAGDLLISAAYAAVCGVSSASRVGAMARLLHERTAEAIHGQAADLSTQGGQPAKLEVYESVAAGKSGSLLSLPLELPLIYAGHSAFAALAKTAAQAFAVGYQIVDDLEDVSRDVGADGRSSALNAVLVLRAAGYGKTAEDQAKARAIALFDIAAERSRALPFDCGRALADAAAKLSRQL